MSRPFRVLLIYPNTMMATLLPLNISILAAALKQAGIAVRLFDTTYYPTEAKNFEQKKVELLQIKPFDFGAAGVLMKTTEMHQDLKLELAAYPPDLVGITLVEDTWDQAVGLLKTVRECCRCPIIAGGVYVTSNAESLIQNPLLDILCLGEGEQALVDLCRALQEKQNLAHIANLWVRQGDRVDKNPMRPPADLDLLPFPDFDVFEPNRLTRPMHGRLFRMLHVELDRGCPYACTYCEAPALAKRYKEETGCAYYRQKSTDRVIAEMRFLKRKYAPDYVNFNSETFLARPVDNLAALGQAYREEIGLPFWCQSRPETVTPEKLAILKSAGCSDLQYGIEHGNEAFRAKVLNRHVSNERMLQACHWTEAAGIPYTVNNILGFPGETRELVWDTIRFNRQIRPKTMNCYFFTPYRGTALYRYCVENGYLDPKAKTRQLLDGGELRYDGISREELRGLQRTFSLYARLEEEFFPKIRIAESFDDEGNRVFAELAELFRQRFMR